MNGTERDWISQADEVQLSVRNFIDGAWREVGGAHVVEKLSPRDGRLLCHFGSGNEADVTAAIRSGREAFSDGRWAKASVQVRKRVLYRLADLIESRRDELALLECLDTGKPITNVREIDLPMAIGLIRAAAESADKLAGKVYNVDSTSLAFGMHRPLGVVGAIVGWNFPIVLAASKLGPALAMGNSIVLKPSEVTSLATARLAELAMEAGLPQGVLNIVHGDAGVGAAIGYHQDVDLVSFTGSSATGKKLLVAAGESNMKRLLLECGGKSANIIFDDCADLDAAADGIVQRAFWNQGQVCTASSRLLVQEGVKDELLSLIEKRLQALRPGDPLDPETTFGALTGRAHQQKVQAYVEAGQTEGSRLSYQLAFTAPFADGCYVPPTIFETASSRHRIAQEEIFGPVLSVLSFADEEEAIRIANDTIYGLSAIVWTTDLGRAHRLAYEIEVGWMTVNATSSPMGGPGPGVLPIGGLKQSGLGAEGGIEGLEHYTSRSSIQHFV